MEYHRYGHVRFIIPNAFVNHLICKLSTNPPLPRPTKKKNKKKNQQLKNKKTNKEKKQNNNNKKQQQKKKKKKKNKKSFQCYKGHVWL